MKMIYIKRNLEEPQNSLRWSKYVVVPTFFPLGLREKISGSDNIDFLFLFSLLLDDINLLFLKRKLSSRNSSIFFYDERGKGIVW